MSAPRPLQTSLLEPATRQLQQAVVVFDEGDRIEARWQILEAAAAALGGFDFHAFREIQPRPANDFEPLRAGAAVAETLRRLPFHPSLGLVGLANPELSASDRRKAGVYFTDFRLARYLASRLVRRPDLLLDPACGNGVLLVAAVLRFAPDAGLDRDRMLAEAVCGADLSADSLRGAFLALASLTRDVTVIRALRPRLRVADSLLQRHQLWFDVAPDGFHAIIGNPPWEKLKVTRHEWLNANGRQRHYGDDYCGTENDGIGAARQNVSEYAEQLDAAYHLQGDGEVDLYKLFIELSLRLSRPGGELAMLVPAGLIRSLGTRELRRYLLVRCPEFDLSVLDNRARFFAIDTRFKFLALKARTGGRGRVKPVELHWAKTDDSAIRVTRKVHLARRDLAAVRPDLTVPEVRSEDEWKAFLRMARGGARFGDPEGLWRPRMMREVDMSRDREAFLRDSVPGAIPLLEGRAVHQFTPSAKSYVSGTGRRAIWKAASQDLPARPQFWFPVELLTSGARERSMRTRVGFCDITGQTNERTMLASLIPAGVVCGNKVPTVLFDREGDPDSLFYTWSAIANSFAFDWQLRRVITTTVNYFLLLDLPFPRLDPMSREGQTLARLANRLHHAVLEPWKRAELRAEVDWRVLRAYGENLDTLRLMLTDFPLLDRSQPPLPNEERSTITRDFLLLRTARALSEGSAREIAELQRRVDAASAEGAVPYIPSHLDTVDAEDELTVITG